jgi:hypothetical protein
MPFLPSESVEDDQPDLLRRHRHEHPLRGLPDPLRAQHGEHNRLGAALQQIVAVISAAHSGLPQMRGAKQVGPSLHSPALLGVAPMAKCVM